LTKRFAGGVREGYFEDPVPFGENAGSIPAHLARRMVAEMADAPGMDASPVPLSACSPAEQFSRWRRQRLLRTCPSSTHFLIWGSVKRPRRLFPEKK
jgi:hypothetical protein